MAYSTQADILARISPEELSQLTSEAEGVIDSSIVDEMIATADGEIDGYVAVRYSVPLEDPPKLIKVCSISIALYRLFERRSNRLGGINDAIKSGYENAIHTLKAIAGGKLSLGVDPPPPASTQASGSQFISGGDREYTNDTLKGF